MTIPINQQFISAVAFPLIAILFATATAFLFNSAEKRYAQKQSAAFGVTLGIACMIFDIYFIVASFVILHYFICKHCLG